MKSKLVPLFNPRGRVVYVKPYEVEKMLAKGFLKVHQDTKNYNPVFDRQANRNYEDPSKPLEPIEIEPKKVLEVEWL